MLESALESRQSRLILMTSFLAFFACCCSGQTITKCTKTGLCSCETELGAVDLSSLSGGDPFKASHQSDDFYWLPCKTFTKGTQTDVGAVQYQTQFDTYYTLGKNTDDLTSSNVTDGMPCFTMKDGILMRQAEVLCVCSSGGATLEYQFETDGPPFHYIFKLTAPQCCPGGGGSGDSSSGGISAGWILTIVFLTCVVLYCVVGVGVQVGVRKAEGQDRIPNVNFWRALPGLIKDGFRFTVSCGKTSTYSKI